LASACEEAACKRAGQGVLDVDGNRRAEELRTSKEKGKHINKKEYAR
jgi:hypothetical protein